MSKIFRKIPEELAKEKEMKQIKNSQRTRRELHPHRMYTEKQSKDINKRAKDYE